MTSTITGLPDRYRPLDEVGPAEITPTGTIRCWRAKDRVLNRDVAIRVHTPGGPAAREWIARALTAGGLATPALAMVYDAAEGSGEGRPGEEPAPGTAAYVVNEWIEGRTLAERLADGPMPEQEVRTVLRRLAEGVAEAHRVGLAVGGVSPETVVLRPNGLVGLRAVPAASGTIQGDIAALGDLLAYCLTGRRPATGPAADAPAGGRPSATAGMAPDLAALVRRARSTRPGSGLSSVAAMAALLAERPRAGQGHELVRGEESDSGWLRRLRERREEERAAGSTAAVAVDPTPTRNASAPRRGGAGLPPVPPPSRRTDPDEDLLPLHGDGADGAGEQDGAGGGTEGRRRLVVVGLPLLALAVVIALAWWFGSNVISVAGSVGEEDTAGPPAATAPAEPPAQPPPATDPADASPAPVAAATVYDPFGDGAPENDGDVPLSYDGDPSTAWSTLQYRGTPAFGNLKDGVGVVYDLGEERSLRAVELASPSAGATVEVRTGGQPGGSLDEFAVVASGELAQGTELALEEPVDTRYVLVWITGLAPAGGGFAAELAEVSFLTAG